MPVSPRAAPARWPRCARPTAPVRPIRGRRPSCSRAPGSPNSPRPRVCRRREAAFPGTGPGARRLRVVHCGRCGAGGVGIVPAVRTGLLRRTGWARRRADPRPDAGVPPGRRSGTAARPAPPRHREPVGLLVRAVPHGAARVPALRRVGRRPGTGARRGHRRHPRPRGGAVAGHKGPLPVALRPGQRAAVGSRTQRASGDAVRRCRGRPPVPLQRQGPRRGRARAADPGAPRGRGMNDQPGWWEPLLDRVAEARRSDFSRLPVPPEGGRPSAVLILLAETDGVGPDVLLLERAGVPGVLDARLGLHRGRAQRAARPRRLGGPVGRRAPARFPHRWRPARTLGRVRASLVDLVLVVLVIIFAINGYRQGFVVGLLSFLGFFGGAAIGLQLGPFFANFFASSVARVFVSLLTVLAFAIGGQAIPSRTRPPGPPPVPHPPPRPRAPPP